jgi:hypothetical protein
VAAQAAADGVRVRGWNWPPGASVTVQADLAGGVTPLAGPLGVTSDSGGRFSTRLGYSAELRGALQSRANVRISARSGDMVAQLPLAAEPGVFEAAGLEGVLTHVERAGGLTNLVLAGFDGTYRRLEMPASAQVRYSEGGTAPPRVLDAGMAVRIEGSSGTGTVAVSRLRIMSESQTGARVGYTWLGTSAVTVSGTGWPQQKAVTFAFGQKGGAHAIQIGNLTADSRGNLVGRLAVPGVVGRPAGGWIEAVAADGGQVLAQVSVPLGEVSDAADGNPPKLFLLAGSGGQRGELGNFCSGGGCSGTRGFPLPPEVLTVSRGEGLRFRAQPGMDPTVAATPASFSVQLYAYPSAAYGGETSIGSHARFELSGQPVYSIAVQEGRPFSMSVPQSLASGAYVLVVSTAWPNSLGRIATSSSAFGVRVP